MNTNSKKLYNITRSGAACRLIGMLFGLFAFIWLPTPEVDASLQLRSPGCNPTDPLCDINLVETDPVTVFRWTQSDNPAVVSYRLIIATDEKMEDVVLDLPKPGDKSIITPQVAVRLESDPSPFLFEGPDNPFFWRVIALDELAQFVEESPIFSSWFQTFQRQFTVISGLVKSDLNQAAIVGAQVAVSSAQHAATDNSNVVTVFNGEYIVIALTGFTDFNSNEPKEIQIPFPIEITSTKEGFNPTTVKLLEPDPPTSTITRDLVMESIADSDGDGISDKVENDSPCLDANDADTDDDGIADGQEDINFNGIRESNEIDPCESDTDKDGIQDGTERGYTMSRIGPYTDIKIFQPDLDPTTRTDPLDGDSDNDGLLDGEEDRNHNGRVDPGETDPRKSERRAGPWIPLLLLGD